jgi:hypothetical protein
VLLAKRVINVGHEYVYLDLRLRLKHLYKAFQLILFNYIVNMAVSNV